jgi:hypothetical protein
MWRQTNYLSVMWASGEWTGYERLKGQRRHSCLGPDWERDQLRNLSPCWRPGTLSSSDERVAQRRLLEGFGGLGVFYWEPEGYAPFTSYTLGAWNSTTKRPTAALNGFLNA